MLNRLKSWLNNPEEDATPDGEADLRLAAAVLLVEAAWLDGDFGAAEEEVIRAALARHFSLEPEEVSTVIDEARAAHDESAGLVRFTRVIKDRLDDEQRQAIIEMLWEVVYADGQLHDYEANLLRRIAGLLYVSDRDSGIARQRVLDRLGLDG